MKLFIIYFCFMQGVSGQSVSASPNLNIDKVTPHTEIWKINLINQSESQVEKDFHTRTLIKEAIEDNDFLKNLSATQVEENFSRHMFEHIVYNRNTE